MVELEVGISVVIPTRNRPHLLPRTLDALLASPYHMYEIIVMDQSDDELTKRVIQEYHQRAPWIFYEHLSRRGQTRGQNRGIEVSRFNIVAFIDDDCIPSANWLQVIADRMTWKDILAITGRILPGESEDGGATARSLDLAATARLHKRTIMPPLFVFAGGNSAVHKSLLAKIGLFDEGLGPGAQFRSGADVDMGYRILRAGHSILYEPELIVHHRSWRDEVEDLSVCFDYGVGLGAFFAKYWSRGDLYALWRLLTSYAWATSRWLSGLFFRDSHLREDGRSYLAGITEGTGSMIRLKLGQLQER